MRKGALCILKWSYLNNPLSTSKVMNMVMMRDNVPINVLTYKFQVIFYQYHSLDETRKRGL